jgi:hypothetical protein
MAGFTERLDEMFAESRKLEKEIKKQGLRYFKWIDGVIIPPNFM